MAMPAMHRIALATVTISAFTSSVATAIEAYQAKPIQPYEARTIAPEPGRQVPPAQAQPGQAAKHQSAAQVRPFTQQDLEAMRRNDTAAGRNHKSMSQGQKGGNAADAQARVNHYSNMQTLNNRMNDAGTIGYNPFRNQ